MSCFPHAYGAAGTPHSCACWAAPVPAVETSFGMMGYLAHTMRAMRLTMGAASTGPVATATKPAAVAASKFPTLGLWGCACTGVVGNCRKGNVCTFKNGR